MPERALHAAGVPRPLFLIFVSLLTAAVALLCAYASLAALYSAALLAGLAFGGHWSLAPALACDFFGLRHFASNYCLLQVCDKFNTSWQRNRHNVHRPVLMTITSSS